MYSTSSTSTDANAARVEAATNDKLKRGEAVNEYAGFGDEYLDDVELSEGAPAASADGGNEYEIPVNAAETTSTDAHKCVESELGGVGKVFANPLFNGGDDVVEAIRTIAEVSGAPAEKRRRKKKSSNEEIETAMRSVE